MTPPIRKTAQRTVQTLIHDVETALKPLIPAALQPAPEAPAPEAARTPASTRTQGESRRAAQAGGTLAQGKLGAPLQRPTGPQDAQRALHDQVAQGKLVGPGASGPAVFGIQEALGMKPEKQTGSMPANGTTQKLLKDFQAKHGLEPDGVVGHATYDALRNAQHTREDQALDKALARPTSRVFKHGDEGPEVAAIQRRLGMPYAQQTGRFDDATLSTLKTAQQKAGMKDSPEHPLGLYGHTTDEKLGGAGLTGKITPFAQHRGDSCGQSSVAMVVNAVTGKHIDDDTIDARYGFELKRGLDTELAGSPFRVTDAGNLGGGSLSTPAQAAEFLKAHVNKGLPVILAGNNGVSSSGNGHIMVCTGISDDGKGGHTLTMADSATGTKIPVPLSVYFSGATHPDGNFVYSVEKR